MTSFLNKGEVTKLKCTAEAKAQVTYAGIEYSTFTRDLHHKINSGLNVLHYLSKAYNNNSNDKGSNCIWQLLKFLI